MEQTLLETIQSLGLDVQLGIILLLLALDGLGMHGRRIAAWRTAQPRWLRGRRIAARLSPATVVEGWRPESQDRVCVSVR